MMFGWKSVNKMMKTPSIKQLKMFIKISIIVVVLGIFLIFGFFVRFDRTFENAHLRKWLFLSEKQQIMTVNQIIRNPENPDLIVKCITKIANLKNSNEMAIRDATVLCYNGIKINKEQNEK